MPKQARYDVLITQIFEKHYSAGIEAFEFERAEIEGAAKKLKITLPKNLGDVIYSFRYSKLMPEKIRVKAQAGLERVIEPAGQALYRFR